MTLLLSQVLLFVTLQRCSRRVIIVLYNSVQCLHHYHIGVHFCRQHPCSRYAGNAAATRHRHENRRFRAASGHPVHVCRIAVYSIIQAGAMCEYCNSNRMLCNTGAGRRTYLDANDATSAMYSWSSYATTQYNNATHIIAGHHRCALPGDDGIVLDRGILPGSASGIGLRTIRIHQLSGVL